MTKEQNPDTARLLDFTSANVTEEGYLSEREYPKRRHCKVWREGLEAANQVKGSQGKRRVEWLKPEYPWSAISAKSEAQANHSEALNSSICRRCSAYRRRQNPYAKTS